MVGKGSRQSSCVVIQFDVSNRTLEGAGWSKDGLRREGFKITAMDSFEKTDKLWYYVAPKLFIGGDKTSAYNGWLEYDLGMPHAKFQGHRAQTNSDIFRLVQGITSMKISVREYKMLTT